MSQEHEFEDFMRNYQSMVFTAAVRLIGNEAEAQDISQEVFLRAYDRFGELKDSPTAGGWLRTVTRNMCINHLQRYRSRWRFFSDLISRDADEAENEVEFAAPGDLGSDLEASDRHEIVEKALQKLPESQRVPLVLYHLEGLRYEEIAAALKVSLGKVKTDIFRGREVLKKTLTLKLSEDFEGTGKGRGHN